MKRFALCVVPLLFVAPSFAFGDSTIENEEGNVVFQAEKVTDIDLLAEMAYSDLDLNLTRSLTESDQQISNNTSQILEIENESSEDELAELPQVTQLLEVREGLNEDGDEVIEEEYAVTFIGDIEEDDDGFQVMNARSGSQWDSAGAVRAYSTINIQSSTINGDVHYRVSSSNGGWEIADSQFSVSNRSVMIQTNGVTANGGAVNGQTINRSPVGNTWSYSAPNTWTYVYPSDFSFIGMASTADVSGRSSSTLTLHNYW